MNFNEYRFGDICVQYWFDTENGTVGLELLPDGMKDKRVSKSYRIDPLVQLMIQGDDFPPGFANGHTMRGSSSLYKFRYKDQSVKDEGSRITVITSLTSQDDQELIHKLTYYSGEQGVEVSTTYSNNGQAAVTLDMLSSFSFGGMTPFVSGDAPNTMVLHRLRSKWSNEARLDSMPIEDLQLEPTWSGHGAFSEKFGQLGSMPVRRFFPFAAIEDTVNHVLWGVQLACPSSWQIEAYRKDNALCLSGGLADYDFGHWFKTIKPGDSFTAPTAFLSVCAGDLDTLCSRLTGMQARSLKGMDMPSRLPVVFNEFCTTWGKPSQESVVNELQALKGKDIDFFVIDAGWYADDVKGWEMNMGDWRVNDRMFPDGMEFTVKAIREAEMKPGIWFELEVCGRDADVFGDTEHLLKRMGNPITAGFRRFWDMRSPWVNDYLEKRVTEFLKYHGFEYVKIDYNESIGIGCDGAESLGEGLRQNIVASRDFLVKMRESVPGMLIENCSSGGHRLEPSLLGICQLASFSDAHEQREIPVIAANLHRVMLPQQSLIWAVLRKDDSLRRLVWSLSATFLGVMCLSGDVHELDAGQWKAVDEAISFYREASSVIEEGITKRHGPKVQSYRHPEGWQAVERTSRDKDKKLIVIHSFDDALIEVQVGEDYTICKHFADEEAEFCMENGIVKVNIPADGACALLLNR